VELNYKQRATSFLKSGIAHYQANEYGLHWSRLMRTQEIIEGQE
jgi:hypothetical protein